jgi:uncharacterized repeat protein (TIGR01451 family)
MVAMFYNATAFNQELGSWNVDALANATSMFTGVTLSTTNYDALLNGWASQTLQPGVIFSGGNSQYCAGGDARAKMISTYGWSITDGGSACYAPSVITQPQSQTVNAGQTATFSAAASGIPTPAVQWQVTQGGGSTWSDISGATATSLTFTASSSQTGYQYRAVITNFLGSAITNPATLTVVGTASISGNVFNDINGSRMQNTGEGNLSGWTVRLQDLAGNVLDSAVTDASGNYQFAQLRAAAYRVRLVLQGSYLQTTANPADIVLVDGQAVEGVNFGAAIPADLKVTAVKSYTAKTGAIAYTITVTNDGPAAALASVFKDVLPSNVSYVSVKSSQGTCAFSSKTVTCNLGTLAPGARATITLKVTRTSTKTPVVNNMSVSSGIYDNDMADNALTVTIK